MPDLELTIMSSSAALPPLLKQFEAEHRVQVQVKVFSWETAWAEIVKMALYGDGPDVSEIGSTWVGSLISMNALRPFTGPELAQIGGPSAFLPSAWQTGSAPNASRMWAVPWLADTRFAFYRRDVLAQAGIDERTAFQTPGQFESALQRLQVGGVVRPWLAPTHRTLVTLHNVASWIWSAGGDFISSNGQATAFNEPAARAGLRAYFDLHRYLMPSDQGHVDLPFLQGKIAVAMGGPTLFYNLASPVGDNLGIALPLGIPFVGGTNLVVWKHTRQANAAVELVRYLTSQEVQATYPQQATVLPVRTDVPLASPLAENPLYRFMNEGGKVGRTFPSVPLWGLVEDRLGVALFQIWSDILADPNADLEAVLGQHLDSLAQRLNTTLGATRK